MIFLPIVVEWNISILKVLSTAKFAGRVVAVARYSDEIEKLEQAGGSELGF
jgi:hypothetical protein